MFSASKSGQYPGYLISRSVRLRSSASAYFNRTLTTPTGTTKWTWSGWVKRGTLGASQTLFSGSSDVNNWGYFGFLSGDTLTFSQADAGSVTSTVTTTQVFRDPSAWYHIVVVFDSTQATAANRLLMYINGVQITSFGTATYLAQNTASRINTANPHQLGRYFSAANYLDGYLTEINFIDGQALTPSSFGQYNAYGVWSPLKYNGTYGTNGFYLNFSDNSAATAAAIGKDYSGNGNNWTPNNISLTAGATYDSMLDVPTPWADGGNGRGNYATLNPLDQVGGRALTTSNGNLNFTGTYGESKSSIQLPESGKYYFEYVWTAIASTPAQFIAGIAGYQSDGQKSTGGAWSAYGASWTTNDVIGAAVDMDAKTVTFYKNGVSQGSISSPSYSNRDILTTSNGSAATNSGYANFGQRPFAYTPPSGFKALNTLNLPTPTILKGNQYFDATLYNGNGSTQSIVNSGGMQPDLVWIKARNATANHAIFDSSRGTGKVIQSNTTAAEATDNTTLTAFDSSGFSLGAAAGSYVVNTNTYTFVGWQWQAGQGSTSSNTSGSITSTVSVNPTAGFSIVTASASGTSPVTMGHGLGVAPSFIIGRVRNNTANWYVYSSSFSSQDYLVLNSTAAKATSSNIWDSAPTSTVLTVGNPQNGWNGGTVGSYNYVLYCWAQVAGFSKFGSYTGNGSADGPFVFCGFRPRWVMIKSSSGIENWMVYDSARDTYNVETQYLIPNSSGAEATLASSIDFTSNGFKIRYNASPLNTSSGTYIFAAFAENPFKNALAR